MILEILYTLVIWPINFILEFLFVLFIRIFDAPGLAIIFLSVMVNTLILPIYLVTDRWQWEERELQKKMKDKLDRIRLAFKGDERQLITNAYYRQMNYSPVLILKASVGLLFQIPFFIAAYQFLTRTSLLSGISFLYIDDLKNPDALLKLSFTVMDISTVNLLPIIMTALNLVSSFIYAKNLGRRERIQLIGISFLFLVLLYNSPSGLVLYWTMNNLYSLIKNAAKEYLKKPVVILKIGSVLIACVFIYLIYTGRANVERYRVLFISIAVSLALVPLLAQPVFNFIDKIFKTLQIKEDRLKETNRLFFSITILLFLLLGVLNPAQVLSASVEDFVNPFSFLLFSMLQGFTFLILIPIFIKVLSTIRIYKSLTYILSIITLICLVCYFGLSAYYGVMDRNFKFDDTDRLLHSFPLWVSIAVPVISVIFISFIFITGKIKAIALLFQAAGAAILVLICIDLVSLGIRSKALSKLSGNTENSSKNTQKYFPLTTNSNNIFIVVLDRAQGTALTDALEYMPSLKDSFDGFVFYPNTVSFGQNTLLGFPPMLGGYEYTPQKINDKSDELLTEKVNSAIRKLPDIFVKENYRVVITDPVIANMQSVPDISIFDYSDKIDARILSGRLVDRYLEEFPGENESVIHSFDFDIIFRYGIFRASIPVLRYGIYYKGQWWREAAYNSYGRAIAEFSSLYYLNEICFVDNQGPVLNILINAITHEGGSYNNELIPQKSFVKFSQEEINKFGSAKNTEYMYTILSAMNQLVRWIDFLKEKSVYDNTRILIVSDHGGHYRSTHDTSGMENFNPVLMMKDYDSRGTIIISEELMTNADMPYLALKNIEENEMKISNAKEIKNETITVFNSVSSQPLRHGPYKYNLDQKRELKGTKVLKNESWGGWEAIIND